MKTKTILAFLLVLLLTFSSASPASAALKTKTMDPAKTPISVDRISKPDDDCYKRNQLCQEMEKYAEVVKNEGVSNTMNQNVIHMLKSVNELIGDSFIITTKDGRVIVIDGGKYQETAYFIEYLKAVTGQQKPHIDAWFLSHPHDDHCEVFLKTAEYADDIVTFDRVYANFPTNETFFRVDRLPDTYAFHVLNEYNRLLPRFADKVSELHKGDDFSIGQARFRVFFTFNPAWKDCNEASTIMRMDLGGKSVMFTGDANDLAGNQVIADYGDSGLLKCDYCKMAHHGANSMGDGFYRAVSPRYCLWPTTEWEWNGGDDNLKVDTPNIYNMMKNEIGVKHHYISFYGSKAIYLNNWYDFLFSAG